LGEFRIAQGIASFVAVAGAFILTACGGGGSGGGNDGGGAGAGSPDNSSGSRAPPTFAASLHTFVGRYSSLILGDLTGDNKPDLLISQPANFSGNVVTMRIGNGDGTFRDAGNAPSVVAFSPLADLDGDGKLDMPYCQGGPGLIAVTFGNGDGTFASPIQYSFGPASGDGAALCRSIAIGDFNGDGIPDIVVVSSLDDEIQKTTRIWISVLHGNGDRSFQSAVRQPVPAFPGFAGLFVKCGDLNADGRSDLLVFTSTHVGAEQASFANYVLMSNGDGTFRTAPGGGLPSPASQTDLDYFHAVIADFNADGRPDLLLASYSSDPAGSHLTVGLYPGNGDGTFRPLTFSYAVAPPYFGSYGIGDFDHDGRPDLVVFETPDVVADAMPTLGNRLRFFRGNADGTMSAPLDYPMEGGFAYLEQIGDLNGDGWPDLLVRSSDDLVTLLNMGPPKRGP